MISRTLQFIRFSHTVFALPFALGAMLVAARGFPTWQQAGLIVLCMVFARTAAMVFNRLADWEIDQQNPRTVDRHRLISRKGAVLLLVASASAFIATTWWINPLCFWLSPVALAIVFFYSLTKRFTSFSHFFLGLALSVSPVGAWFAMRGAELAQAPELALKAFDFSPFLLAAAVLLWVAGFDMIYATQDYEFDRRSGLRSMVVKLGIDRSLQYAQRLHWAMLVLLGLFGWLAGLGLGFAIGMVVIVGAIVYEHRSARGLDIAAINKAFFHSNALVGAVFLVAVGIDVFRLS